MELNMERGLKLRRMPKYIGEGRKLDPLRRENKAWKDNAQKDYNTFHDRPPTAQLKTKIYNHPSHVLRAILAQHPSRIQRAKAAAELRDRKMSKRFGVDYGYPSHTESKAKIASDMKEFSDAEKRQNKKETQRVSRYGAGPYLKSAALFKSFTERHITKEWLISQEKD